MDWEERIAVNREILAGKPVIRGTRVPVRVLLGALAGGDSMEDVCNSYRVAAEDVRAALAYAAEAVDYAVIYLVPGGGLQSSIPLAGGPPRPPRPGGDSLPIR